MFDNYYYFVFDLNFIISKPDQMKFKYVLILFLLLNSITKAQEIKRFDTLFNYLKIKDDFNGNVLFAEKGNVVYQRSFGYANFATKTPLTENSVFELASLSKGFTSMGILILMQRGKLSLNDSLRVYFHDLPYKNITIRNLLTHTSGIPDYMEFFENHWDKSKIASNINVLSLFAQYKPPVHFVPGDRFEYSNTNYVLLAMIIEKVSGLSYEDFLQKNIFAPLNMDHTRVFNRMVSKKEHLANYAYSYIVDEKGQKPVLADSIKELNYVVYLDGIVGDGSVISTISDLFKWDRALYTNKLVQVSTLNEAFTPFKFNDGNESGYAFGWGVRYNDKSIGKCIYVLGSWAGYDNFLARFIDTDKTIIILRNVSNHNKVNGVYESYINILFDKPNRLPQINPQ